MKRLILLGSLLFSFFVNAQENLLNMLSQDKEPVYISYLFKGTKVVNGQSVELPGKGILQFNIQHRFGTLNSGLYNLYGVDFSQVRLSFDYGLKDWGGLGIGRSSTLKIVDANMKEINIQEVNSNQQKEVNISDLPKGLYYIILTKENQKITNSVVKF